MTHDRSIVAAKIGSTWVVRCPCGWETERELGSLKAAFDDRDRHIAEQENA